MKLKDLFPAEIVTNVPRITMTGNELIQVEQHRGLITCLEDEVAFKTSLGVLSVKGKGLQFRHYSAQDAAITGEIMDVCLREDSADERRFAILSYPGS